MLELTEYLKIQPLKKNSFLITEHFPAETLPFGSSSAFNTEALSKEDAFGENNPVRKAPSRVKRPSLTKRSSASPHQRHHLVLKATLYRDATSSPPRRTDGETERGNGKLRVEAPVSKSGLDVN